MSSVIRLVETESGGDTPALLAVELTTRLPQVVVEGEEDGIASSLLADRVESSNLVLGAGDGSAVGITLGRPASLQVDHGLAADALEDLHLSLDELTSILSLGVGVEEGVDVGTSDVNVLAQGAGDVLALPDVEGLRDGVRTLVAGALGLDNLNKLNELTGRAVSLHDGLVTDNDQLDHVPVSPLGDGVNLLLDIGGIVRASVLDEDTNDHLETVLLASRDDSLEGVAVSGVDTDDLETSLLDLGDVLVNGVSRLAVTRVGSVGGVGDTVVITAAANRSRVGLGGLRRLGLRLGAGLGLRGRLGLRSRSRQARAGERAVGNVAGLGDGDNLLGGSVSAGVVAGGGGVHDNGGLSDRGGVRVDGVGTSAGADVGGHQDGAVGDGAAGADGSDRAGHNGGGLDDSGDTTNGVGARRDLGGGGSADGGGLADGDGRGRDGVSAGRRAGVRVRSRNNDDLGGGGWLRGRGGAGSSSDGVSLGLGAGSSHSGGWLDCGGGRHDCEEKC